MTIKCWAHVLLPTSWKVACSTSPGAHTGKLKAIIPHYGLDSQITPCSFGFFKHPLRLPSLKTLPLEVRGLNHTFCLFSSLLTCLEMWKVNLRLCLEIALKTEKSKGLTPCFCVFRDGQSCGRCLLQRMPAIEWSHLPPPHHHTKKWDAPYLLTTERRMQVCLQGWGSWRPSVPPRLWDWASSISVAAAVSNIAFVSWIWSSDYVLSSSELPGSARAAPKGMKGMCDLSSWSASQSQIANR